MVTAARWCRRGPSVILEAGGRAAVKPDEERHSLDDYVGMAVIGVVALVLLAGYGWIVSGNTHQAMENLHMAQRQVREAAAEFFRGFTALPATAPESAFQDVMKEHAAEITAFDVRAGRTEVSVRIHKYYDTQVDHGGHLRYCFAYTLTPPDVGRSTYREMECAPGWSVWDLAF
ncbi:hypothetical protein [Streptosporangium sp. NPDC049376]|uniref:hypothetical protein n=1 Tax=Streptosporangium sp. NPDC049376 TaxID=3366192 RepID=UPI0037AB5D36